MEHCPGVLLRTVWIGAHKDYLLAVRREQSMLIPDPWAVRQVCKMTRADVEDKLVLPLGIAHARVCRKQEVLPVGMKISRFNPTCIGRRNVSNVLQMRNSLTFDKVGNFESPFTKSVSRRNRADRLSPYGFGSIRCK